MKENNSKSSKKEYEYFKNPQNIQFLKDLTENSFSPYYLDNLFIVFNSINDVVYLIYVNQQNSIICYNLLNNQKLNEIFNAHQCYISNLRHILDKNNKRDLILSISADNSNIKIWELNSWNCVFNIEKIYDEGFVYSACFLMDNNQILIVASHYSKKCSEYIKIYDLNGNKKKEIYESDDETCFIDSFYDTKMSKNYIITGIYKSVKSFDYKNNRLYYEYKDKQNCHTNHTCIIIDQKDNIIRLIESSSGGYIRIWDFYTGLLLNRISSSRSINCICLWNDEYLFVGCQKGIIRLLDLNNYKYIKDFTIDFYINNNQDHLFDNNNYLLYENKILTIKKIVIPNYGGCLIICHGSKKNYIKMFKNNI